MEVLDIKDIYENYAWIIYGRCLRILKSEDEAKDAMQTVFLKLMDNLAVIRKKDKVVPWLYRTAQNHCFNQLRYRKKFSEGTEVDTLGSTETGNVENRLNARQVIHLVMEKHPRRVQEAVYYTFVERLEQKEIHRITGQSPATIRRNLAVFKNSLQKEGNQALWNQSR